MSPSPRRLLLKYFYTSGYFPVNSMLKSPPAKAGDMYLIPASGRSPGEEYGNPLQYSCLENSMDRGAWQTTIH